MSAGKAARRRRTRFWLSAYTLLLLGIAVGCLLTQQWSVAITALAITVLFALFIRHAWRKR